jgi:hypothetical protein
MRGFPLEQSPDAIALSAIPMSHSTRKRLMDLLSPTYLVLAIVPPDFVILIAARHVTSALKGFNRGDYSTTCRQIENPAYNILFRKVHDFVRAIGTDTFLTVRD